MKKWIRKLFELPDQIYNRIIFFIRHPQMNEMPQIKGRIYMVGDRDNISFGSKVRINSNLQSNPIGGSSRTILFARPTAKISIGNNVGISNSAIFAAKSIDIGNNVLIGAIVEFMIQIFIGLILTCVSIWKGVYQNL